MSEPTDRLYELLPPIYRIRDEQRGFPLRDLLRVVTEQADVVQSDIERLYRNWFIETCDDWVVPYIGDLVGWTAVHEAGEPGELRLPREAILNRILVPRRDVAHTIRNRRRKGTLALLEQLAADVAGWPARAVESYRLLGWTQHVNHPWPLRGRRVEIRDADALDRLGGPFDESAHTVDVRRPTSHRTRGWFAVPDVVLWACRLRTYTVTGAPARCVEQEDENCFTFSVLGNDAPLFARAVLETESWTIAGERNLPLPLRRRAVAKLPDDFYGAGKSFRIVRIGADAKDAAGDVVGSDTEIPAGDLVVADLSEWAYSNEPGRVVVDPVLGRIAFRPGEVPEEGVRVDYVYGFGGDVGGGEYARGISEPVGAKVYRVVPGSELSEIRDALARWKGEAPKDAVIEIADSGEYSERLMIDVPRGRSLQLRAAAGTRPVLSLLDYRASRSDALSIKVGAGARVTLDGLLIAGRGVAVRAGPGGEIPAGCDAGRVVLRHCTLIPGWALGPDCECTHPSKPSLRIDHFRGRVIVESSLIGAIQVVSDEVNADPVVLDVKDSVIDATSDERDAVSGHRGSIAHLALTIRRSTVFGAIRVQAVDLGEDTIFQGLLRVARRQRGCIRYSSVLLLDETRTPRRYRCQPDLAASAAESALAADHAAAQRAAPTSEEIADARSAARERVTPRFASVRYGTPYYVRLADDVAEEIARGAHDESEMGVFHDLYEPQRAANLRARLDEYTPARFETGVRYAT